MSALIEAIGPLAFWVIALGLVPAGLLISAMAFVDFVSDRLAASDDIESLTGESAGAS